MIPGYFDFADLYDAIVAVAPNGATMVELGTFFGASAHHLASQIRASGKALAFDTWDDWRGVPPEPTLGYPGWTGPRLEERRVRESLISLPVQVRTGDTVQAAHHYVDGGVFFVFLDDDHTSVHVLRECLAWWPKVQHGGVMAGHDYDWPTVRSAVDFFAAEVQRRVEPVSARCWQIVKT